VTEQRFRHLATGRIRGAEYENALSHVNCNSQGHSRHPA
jgi:hypothetical protein